MSQHGCKDKMSQYDPEDFVESKIISYEKLVKSKKAPAGSRILPVGKSIKFKEWILPSAEVLELLKSVEIFAVTDCNCRKKYKRCDNPVDVCLSFDDKATRQIEKGIARQISFADVVEILEETDKHGLVHFTFYQPDSKNGIEELCSCCSCCCHESIMVKQYNRSDLITKSNYIAEHNEDECLTCLNCVDICSFEAWTETDDGPSLDQAKCLGCGVCAANCKAEAISLIQRN
jgi:Pyruvate/2-oxoacid:ferredoxin oxidoreductase delta subunit